MIQYDKVRSFRDLQQVLTRLSLILVAVGSLIGVPRAHGFTL